MVDTVTKATSPTEDSSSSTAGPAEEGGSAGMREEKSSFLRTYTINKLQWEGPVSPQRKRKTDDPTGDGNPSKKKTNVSFTEELTLTGCITRGRKRRAEEAPVLDESCPVRKKRACRR
ncbi:unnamed protein product [Pleuronectes platessa]|uniref:Uncharacterized protein n=1 Tax=Pleuronectes platessa TaxID=8262 RepID=A0A9N7U6Q6_PLEPL|nr:unnamed protein product [Pleuronectes platessa]